MFEIGFSEILIIAVIALLVLGPEKLPKAARFAGLWMRRARAQWYSVKSEFERELAQDELRRSLAEPLAAVASELDGQMRALDDSARATYQEATRLPSQDLAPAVDHDPSPAFPMTDPVSPPANDPQPAAPSDPTPAAPADMPAPAPHDPPPASPRDPAAPPA